MRLSAVFALLSVCALGLVAAVAAEPDQPATPAPAVFGPVPAAQVPTIVFDTPAVSAAGDAKTDKTRDDHLRKAADHLRAADLDSLADHVRGLSSVTRHPQSPDRHRPQEPVAQVLLQVRLLELDAEKLNRLGLEFSQLQPGGVGLAKASPQDFNGVLSAEAAEGFNGLLEALRADKLARVLAEPNLVTVSGRPVHFHTGGEIMLWDVGPNGTPVSRPQPYGTIIDAIPILTDKGQLRLELRFEYSEPDRSRSVKVAGHENPAFRKTAMETALQMKLGQTFVLHGPSLVADSTGNDTHLVTTLLLVKAEAIDPVAPVATAPSPAPRQRR